MTRQVKVGNLIIGGGNDIVIQSMANTKTYDVDATVAQILALEKAGCQLVRCSVPDLKSAQAFSSIKKNIHIPLVADIHFDYKLAIAAADNGADKIRINPGNIGSSEKVEYLAKYLSERNIPIRIGVNSGSIEKEFLDRFGSTPTALVESALRHVAILEKFHFYDIIISVKASNVLKNIESYRLLSSKCDYPLHLGVTEAGLIEQGLVKSAIGIGTLLMDGIGDTIRVSLTDDPVKEVYAAKDILAACGKLDDYVEIVACPTCARTEINVRELAHTVRECTAHINRKLTIAVMGCIVNGIGEGKEADFGIAGGKEKSALMIKGRVVRTVKNEDIASELIRLIEDERSNG